MPNRVTINVEDNRDFWGPEVPEKAFKVIKLVNTVDYKIGQHLTVEAVKDLTQIDGYTINIVAPKK